ncbi:MAG: hypothetical protein KH359_05650 [Clostridiales bacterium]|nr:hypothetical protein [Clostridiales bacterium]
MHQLIKKKQVIAVSSAFMIGTTTALTGLNTKGQRISGSYEYGMGKFIKCSVCAFYSIVGFSEIVIIPSLAIMAPKFIVCSIVSPILMAIKVANRLLKKS